VDGARSVRVYSEGDGIWTLHAEGEMAPNVDVETSTLGAHNWPPIGARPLDVTEAYDDLLDLSIGYGPTFQGLRAAWMRGDELFAEVELPDTGGFAIHPALLDAAMHVGLMSLDETSLPFAWTGVTLHASGATALRVRLAPGENGGTAIEIADQTGQPVLSVESLVSRPVSPEQLTFAGDESLFQIHWNAIDVGESGDLPTVLEVASPDGEIPDAVRSVLDRVLGVVQDWLADPTSAKLVVVTRNAVSAEDGDGADVRQAPVWGIVRAAEAEHPGRFVLVDIDDTTESRQALAAAVATEEPEIAIRRGQVRIPRLVKMSGGTSPVWDGPVLITGGTGALGALVAKHLVMEHGVRSLVLASRQGIDAPGAADLRMELSKLGAAVRIAACDVSNRDALADLLADHTFSGVVHIAGTADNATIQELTPDRLDSVLAKADGAWYLHELTRDLDLTAFVMFSSAAALVPTEGQGNYAAANVFMDALAAQRQAQGLPATSLAYGLWNVDTGMTGSLSAADLERVDRTGLRGLSAEQALKLLDAGLGSGEAMVAPLRIDQKALRERHQLPALLRGLAPARRAVVQAPILRERLAGLTAVQGDRVILEVVRNHVSAVLGNSSIDPERTFDQLGFDSATSIELRNRLDSATGLRLPATLVFDHPTVNAVTALIAGQLTPSDPTLDTHLDKLESMLDNASVDDAEHALVSARLRTIAAKWIETRGVEVGQSDIESATAERLFDILDNER
jgi:short-subunit dehydrogenase/acyl carrier protein